MFAKASSCQGDVVVKYQLRVTNLLVISDSFRSDSFRFKKKKPIRKVGLVVFFCLCLFGSQRVDQNS